MTPIVLKLFVSNSNEQAGSPGNPQKHVTAVHQKAINTASPGPNDHLFDGPAGAGNISLTLAGITDEVKGQLRGGKKITVTIEDDEPAAAGSSAATPQA